VDLFDWLHIDRVDENPEGYVIIEDDKGKEIKLPEKGNLTKVADLTPAECRNIFIIRNSDLSIARESEFYTNVTDRLTGLRTEEISKIKKKLKELGRLTREDSKADFSDSQNFGKIKSRLNNAERLIQKVLELQEEIKRENFDKLEEEYVRYDENLREIEQQIENLENAGKREKYEKGEEVLHKLKEALGKLKDLEIYNEGDKQLWRDCEKETQTYNKEKEALLTDLKKNEKELKKISQKLREEERDFRVFDERKKKLDDEVKPELKNYEIKSGELTLQERKSKFFTSIGTISAILLGISLLGLIVSPSLLFYILVVLFLISTVVSWIFKFQFVRDRAWLAGAFERIKLTLSKFGLSAESIKEILSNIQKFDEGHSKKAEELEEIRTDKKVLESDIKKLREERIPEIEKKIENAKNEIDGLRRKSREGSLQEYAKKLKLKQKHEKSLGVQGGILESLFGAKSETLEKNIPSWNGEIKDLEEYKDKAKDIEYDEKTVSGLKEGKEPLEGELIDIKDKMGHFQKDLEEIEREANKIIQLEADYFHCKTSVDLDAVRNKLQEFINENGSNKDNVLGVMKIFEEIEIEEREKVSELFGKDSSISKYFNEITDGFYEEVLFNQEMGEIEVRRKDGVILEAEKLSGGAYDQLYLSIRLALGEKLLKGMKGFFIMDDPFVKADLDRLQRQIEMLKKISELGWQVMYFSAKGEVRDALEEDIKKGAINSVEIQSIFP